MTDQREFFEKLVYHSADGRRFTQQSPVMPDVWIQYGMNPGRQVELLMEPHWDFTPARLAEVLRERLALDKDARWLGPYRDPKGRIGPAAIACNKNVVAVRLWFDQLLRAALPMCQWWRKSVARLEAQSDDDDYLEQTLASKAFARELERALANNAHAEIPADVIWLARVAGVIAFLHTAEGRSAMARRRTGEARVDYLQKLRDDPKRLTKAFIGVYRGIVGIVAGDPLPLHSVNRNRPTVQSLYESVNAIKGDAATQLFTTRGGEIAWAVVDSGIDAEHMAFRKMTKAGGRERPVAEAFSAPTSRRRRLAGRPRPAVNNTRVKATYDFINVRELLGAEPGDVDTPAFRRMFPVLASAERRKELKQALADQKKFVVDWERFEPFLEIRHEKGQYRPPVNRHGTHVAGIIGADWRLPQDGDGFTGPSQGRKMCGVAPDIELYDIRVLDDDGNGTEFAIISALQFIRDLNNRRDFVAVHGANLSFSIPHDVANYACGRTPVCEEAETLVSSGVVVVAAAGNSGRARYVTPSGLDDDGFRTVSITDPGNAAGVITVGATHRSEPHTYGVSYFSSRGPTGDGRIKPDLVAPGEKIRSTVPGDRDALLDGTSMAAPHVSGAAALVLARHRELVNQPQRVKQILCASATDLGRERYFQGAGLLDVLRALQSV